MTGASREGWSSGPADQAGGAHPLIETLAEALAQGQTARIERILCVISSRPPFIASRLRDIERLLEENGRSNLLEAAVLQSLASVDYPPRALAGLKDLAARHGFPEAFGRVLAARKHMAAAGDTQGMLIERAERLALTIRIDPRIVQALFPHRQRQEMALKEWEDGLRFAAALEKITTAEDFGLPQLAAFMHPQCREKLNEVIANDRAALFIIGHTGFSAARNLFINEFLGDAIPFRRAFSRPPYVWERDDGRTALFCCLRALKAGTSVILAPDGPMGEVRTPINVLDFASSMATGGIFLAHEAGADAVWLNFAFRNGYFEPVFIKAPQPGPGERLKVYLNRFVGFYEAMLNLYFTADPRSMVVRNRWKSTFLGRGAGRQTGMNARSATQRAADGA